MPESVSNISNTAKRLGKQFCLFFVWIESVFVCFFNHASYNALNYVKVNI
jgi:hypothetical protein